MKLTKSETNNAIIATLTNVRKHPNADKLQLATVLGTQVIVGLDAIEGQKVIYFDSNLQLSYDYLHNNNLYSKPELNKDTSKKGYFGNNGRVRAQKLRGELSNGYVAELESLGFIGDPHGFVNLQVGTVPVFNDGDEFTHINGIEICKKYVINTPGIHSAGGRRGKKKLSPVSAMFHKHWDTKQLMRESDSIPDNSILYIEEKIHGTSGRTANVLCDTGKRWYEFWKPNQIWKVLSGTRRMDDIDGHITGIRREIEGKIASNLHKGEEAYYEIYGYAGAAQIQKGFAYGCKPNQYKVILYRVTVTTPDGYCVDLDREAVYRRAEELGFEKPTLLRKMYYTLPDNEARIGALNTIIELVNGRSALDLDTLREGVAVWFKSFYGSWMCLKHKSEEFLMLESKQRDEEIGDVEDTL